jgi:hypothetical protein
MITNDTNVKSDKKIEVKPAEVIKKEVIAKDAVVAKKTV